MIRRDVEPVASDRASAAMALVLLPRERAPLRGRNARTGAPSARSISFRLPDQVNSF
jgi:hypothetical protein